MAQGTVFLFSSIVKSTQIMHHWEEKQLIPFSLNADTFFKVKKS